MVFVRAKRVLCIFLAALISFSLLSELTPVSSDASAFTEDIADEQIGLADSADLNGNLTDNAKKTKKKKSVKNQPGKNKKTNVNSEEVRIKAEKERAERWKS